MAEKQPGDHFKDTQDPKTTHPPNTAQNLTNKGHPFSFAALILMSIAVLLLIFAIFFSISSTTVFIFISTLVSTLGVVLQLPSTGEYIETAVKNLHNNLEKQSQHFIRIFVKPWKKHWIISTLLSSLIIVGLLFYLLFPLVFPPHIQQTVVSKQQPTVTTNPISVVQTPYGAYVGLSYGLTNFDTDRADESLKNEAAQALKENNTNAAKGYWQLAVREDRTDAEASIYQEDQNVLDSSNDYVTLVVVATLTGQDQNAINVGRSILQGASVAQKEYNRQHKLSNGLLVRLIIANVDDPSIYAEGIAKRITEVDTATFVGVVGQLSNADDAIQELSKAHIPMISSTTLYSTIETSYLFSVAPSIQREADVAAQAAIKVSQDVVLLYDPENGYSTNLAQNFQEQFKHDGGTIVENTYTIGKAKDTLPGRIEAAMSSIPTPGLVYLAGYPDDASFLVPYMHLKWPDVQVMGGDVLSQYIHSSDFLAARDTFNNMLFTSFAFHSEWKGHVAQEPVFFSEYAQDFGAQKQRAGIPYDYLLPDSDTILSYDAISVVLTACNGVLPNKDVTLTPNTLWKFLKHAPPFSGVSGQIIFGNDGEPSGKAVVLLQVKPAGTNLVEIGRYPRSPSL